MRNVRIFSNIFPTKNNCVFDNAVGVFFFGGGGQVGGLGQGGGGRVGGCQGGWERRIEAFVKIQK